MFLRAREQRALLAIQIGSSLPLISKRGAPPTDSRAAAYQSIIYRQPLDLSY